MQYKILVVEDNPLDVEMVQWAVEQAGLSAKLRVLTDGAAALDYVRRLSGANVPDLAILDLSLPWATGEEVLEEFRSNPNSAGVPVIISSSNIGHPAYFRRLQVHGANRVFLKPMEMKEFLTIGTMARELLESAETGSAEPASPKRLHDRRLPPHKHFRAKVQRAHPAV